MDLSRKDLILKYIVEYFIRTASPVGSHTLIEEYQLPYSSRGKYSVKILLPHR